MPDWLFDPVDSSRAHLMVGALTWHGRLMVLAWGFLAPAGVIVARFFKVWPGQRWPSELDNRNWWYTHLATQGSVIVLVVIAVGLAVSLPEAAAEGAGAFHTVHAWLGWSVATLALVQLTGGWLRGSKGGPSTLPGRNITTSPGDHFEMTMRRVVFEHMHKICGYLVLILGAAAVLTGLWHANAPGWMFAALLTWWAMLTTLFIICQYRGMAVDTYQAIWGPDPALPGNRRRPIGLGIRRGKHVPDTRH